MARPQTIGAVIAVVDAGKQFCSRDMIKTMNAHEISVIIGEYSH
jgi:hypothetical protein